MHGNYHSGLAFRIRAWGLGRRGFRVWRIKDLGFGTLQTNKFLVWGLEKP